MPILRDAQQLGITGVPQSDAAKLLLLRSRFDEGLNLRLIPRAHKAVDILDHAIGQGPLGQVPKFLECGDAFADEPPSGTNFNRPETQIPHGPLSRKRHRIHDPRFGQNLDPPAGRIRRSLSSGTTMLDDTEPLHDGVAQQPSSDRRGRILIQHSSKIEDT